MMEQRSSSALTTALLGAICLSLATIVYREFNGIETIVEPARPAAASVTRHVLAEKTFAMAPMERFSAIVKRPIFSPNRRPAAKQPESKKQQRPQSKLALYGIAITAGERIALVGVERGTGLARIKKGEAFSGWVVIDIEQNRVLLRQGTLDEELKLNYGVPPFGK